ncbi:MAG TPA: hypothetical protein VFC58_03385 [Desulfosporosinus sp.]|nr:hypothetical protein [Desulfosporosinus sp.]
MSIIKGVLEEEYERLKRMEIAYSSKINELPKGSIQIKTIKGRKYAYLARREGKRVVTQYLSTDEDHMNVLLKQIEQRKKFKKEIRQIHEDFKVIKRAIRL